MSKTYSAKGPDGKTYSIVGPDNADTEEVKKRIISNYKGAKPPRPTMGQRMKGAASKVVTKVGQKVGEKFPFMKTPSSMPEIVGQMMGGAAGGLLGAETGSMAPGIVGAGVGGSMGRALGQAPQAIGEMLATRQLRTPTTRKIKQEFIPAFERGATFQGLGEAVPIGWRGAKAIGRTFREGAGSLEGVAERIAQLRKLPLQEQLSILRPGRSPTIPSPKVAGAMQGAVEERLGIPTVKEVAEERIYGDTKTPKSIRGLTLSTKAAETSGATPEQASRYSEALKKAMGQVAKPVEKTADVMKRVYRTMKEGGKPILEDAVKALRETASRYGKLARDHPDRAVYSEQMGKLSGYIGEKLPEYAKARKLTNIAHIRDELMSLLPRAPSGDPYRFAVMRLIYMASSFLAGRFSPMAGVLMAGAMSPGVGAAGTIAGDLLTKAVDPVLMNKFAPAGISGAVAALQSRRKR